MNTYTAYKEVMKLTNKLKLRSYIPRTQAGSAITQVQTAKDNLLKALGFGDVINETDVVLQHLAIFAAKGREYNDMLGMWV